MGGREDRRKRGRDATRYPAIVIAVVMKAEEDKLATQRLFFTRFPSNFDFAQEQ
jgi:hypothetical protein